MKVLFTQAFWMELDSIDDAADVIASAEPAARKAYRDNITQVLDSHELEAEELEGKMGWLGTSFWAIDDEQPLFSE